MGADPNLDNSVVVVEVLDRVATITLNRPESRNALNRELRATLPKVVLDADNNDEVDVIIITGADPAFCAGLDLKELGAGGNNEEVVVPESGDGTRRGPFGPTVKPVIGAINGACITGGFELALECDWLVASERARFADTHARVGLQPGWGLSVLLPEAVGYRRARELSTTGNFLDAETALQWGLVNHVVPHVELLPFCRRLGLDIVSNDQGAVRAILETYDENELLDGRSAWHNEARNARKWIKQGGGASDEIERRRRSIMERGRGQVT
jgi:enoyl-CoA hydratase